MITLLRKLKTFFFRTKLFLNNSHQKDIFTQIHNENIWGDAESLSGEGSNSQQTRAIIDYIPALITELGIKSFLDIPCGDFNWMKKVNLSNVSYMGGDIVTDLIEANKKIYSDKNRSFELINLLQDDIPHVDMLFCRDCLVHFSEEDILRALQNIKKSGSKFLLTTSFPNRIKNKKIKTGDWRPLNLEIAPFNLRPIRTFNEKCTEGNMKFTDKSLILIQIKDIFG